MFFKKYKELTIKELVERSRFSKQMVHQIVKRLVEEKRIEKLGSPPKTVYRYSALKAQRPPENKCIFTISESRCSRIRTTYPAS